MIRKLFFATPLFFTTTLLLMAQSCPNCMTCHDFCTNQSGYFFSQLDCNTGKDCHVVLLKKQSYLDSLHPGMFLREERSALIVVGVIPGSPAFVAGIMPGDEIVTLNGQVPTQYSCSLHQWESNKSPGFSTVVISRAGRKIQVDLKLIQLRQLLARGWSSRVEQPLQVAFSQDEEETPWLFGFKWKKEVDSIEVTDVLLGSNASQAGLIAGDKIVAIDGVRVSSLGAPQLSSLLPTDRPASVRITVNNRAKVLQLSISNESLSAALRGLTRMSTPKPAKPQSLSAVL